MTEFNLHRRALLIGDNPKRVKSTIFPPWSLPQVEFIDVCERCDLCHEACPERIIHKGKGGFPEVNFSQAECTFCGKCLLACQSNAFIPKKKYRATEAWPKKQASILSKCLSLNAIMCRSCADYCDADAIQFQLKLGGIAIPKIAIDKCTACGACVHACPNQSIEITDE